MYILNSGMSPIEVRVMQYTPKTRIDLEWFQTEDGNYHATDWNYDVYETSITTLGTQSYVNAIRTAIENSRTGSSSLVSSLSRKKGDQSF